MPCAPAAPSCARLRPHVSLRPCHLPTLALSAPSGAPASCFPIPGPAAAHGHALLRPAAATAAAPTAALRTAAVTGSLLPRSAVQRVRRACHVVGHEPSYHRSPMPSCPRCCCSSRCCGPTSRSCSCSCSCSSSCCRCCFHATAPPVHRPPPPSRHPFPTSPQEGPSFRPSPAPTCPGTVWRPAHSPLSSPALTTTSPETLLPSRCAHLGDLRHVLAGVRLVHRQRAVLRECVGAAIRRRMNIRRFTVSGTDTDSPRTQTNVDNWQRSPWPLAPWTGSLSSRGRTTRGTRPRTAMLPQIRAWRRSRKLRCTHALSRCMMSSAMQPCLG